jgi:hypothetical protein
LIPGHFPRFRPSIRPVAAQWVRSDFARREDVRDRRSALHIDDDAILDMQSGALGNFGIGQDANAGNHHVSF